jgi:DNA-binding transcriptional MerR regulator
MNSSNFNQSFSVDDIRRIRIDDDKRYLGMTPEEIVKDIHERAKEAHQILMELKRNESFVRQE